MARFGRVDAGDAEYPTTNVFPELGLVMWADVKAEDFHLVGIESLLVRRRAPSSR